MKISRKNKRILKILVIMICLGFLIPLGIRALSRPETSTAPTESGEPVTLETLLGADYPRFLTDTITMQMENRMDKNPEVRYYPIEDNAPLSDYATIGADTRFELDGEGYLTIIFPAGTVTAPSHGEQRFRIIRVEKEG